MRGVHSGLNVLRVFGLQEVRWHTDKGARVYVMYICRVEMSRVV